jgi:hypothetical protein
MTGSKVAQYEILERLGSGGMGEIYRARDTRLNRMVAIKVLPTGDSDDEKRRRRFLQEAQAASGLNHPNIITVHDILTEAAADYLVMELINGQTLADLIPPEGMLQSDVLNYGIQMAAAFSAAHAAGIVHRDIKPGNIMITSAKLVKVLDFGLAKATFKGFAGETSETIGGPLTSAGTIMGTVNYMSPEQAEGKPCDSRSDIFSFGIVLYEMITGQSAFASDSVIATMSAILRDDPKPIVDVAPSTSPELIAIVAGCLRKEREARIQSIEEVRQALEELKKVYDPGTAPTVIGTQARMAAAAALATRTPPKKVNYAFMAVAAAGLLAIAGGGWWVATRRTAPPPPAEQKQETAAATPPATAPPEPAKPPVDAVLINDSIAQMVEAKVRPSVIMDHIRSASKTRFDLSTSEVIRLTKAGVPETVLQQMRDPKRVAVEKSAALPASSAPPVSMAPAGDGTPPPPAPAPIAAPVATIVPVPDGLSFTVQLAQDIPNDAKLGMPLKFQVIADVVAGGHVIVAKGAMVNGTIAEEGRRAALVTLKKVSYQVSDVEAAGGQRLKLRATQAGGSASSRRAVEPGKKKAKDVASPAGTDYVVYIDSGQTLTLHR